MFEETKTPVTKNVTVRRTQILPLKINQEAVRGECRFYVLAYILLSFIFFYTPFAFPFKSLLLRSKQCLRISVFPTLKVHCRELAKTTLGFIKPALSGPEWCLFDTQPPKSPPVCWSSAFVSILRSWQSTEGNTCWYNTQKMDINRKFVIFFTTG